MDYPTGPEDQFLAISAVLTAYSTTELTATGQVTEYWNVVLGVIGTAIAGDLLSVCGKAFAASANIDELEKQLEQLVMKDPCYGPIAQRILGLWYTSTWNPMPVDWCDTYGIGQNDAMFIPSKEAYKAGLVWPTFGSQPPAAKAPGFGSWEHPPIDIVNTDPPRS